MSDDRRTCESGIRGEGFFSERNIVSIFWLPISIGASRLRIYNFLAADRTRTIGCLMKRIGTYARRSRESGAGPWLLESSPSDDCSLLWRSTEIRNWKFTLVTPAMAGEFVANARGNVGVSVRSEEKRSISLGCERASYKRTFSNLLAIPCRVAVCEENNATWATESAAPSCAEIDFVGTKRIDRSRSLNGEIFKHWNFLFFFFFFFFLIGRWGFVW